MSVEPGFRPMTRDEIVAQEHSREAAAIAAEIDATGNPFDSLTPRERDIACRLALGDRNADIADALGISMKTVDTHRSHVLKKLGCRHNVDLARLAIRSGNVSL